MAEKSEHFSCRELPLVKNTSTRKDDGDGDSVKFKGRSSSNEIAAIGELVTDN